MTNDLLEAILRILLDPIALFVRDFLTEFLATKPTQNTP